MSPTLRDLYQRRILELNARPQNFGPLPGHTHEGTIHNPLCGDVVTLRLRLDDGMIIEARFEGNGCAVSRASKGRGTSRAPRRSGRGSDSPHPSRRASSPRSWSSR